MVKIKNWNINSRPDVENKITDIRSKTYQEKLDDENAKEEYKRGFDLVKINCVKRIPGHRIYFLANQSKFWSDFECYNQENQIF